MAAEGKKTMIYTIVHTSVDSDRGSFPSPQAEGSYLSFERAHSEMWRLVAEEKKQLDDRYDTEESGDDFWEIYEGGYAAQCSSRFDILSSEVHVDNEGDTP